MRYVLIGASPVAVATAKTLIARGDEVVIVEADDDKVEQLSEELDCGFMVGDGSHPAILKEASPENTDVLFCLSDSDQDNIIASLVGRSQGFSRVVTKIRDPEYEGICSELGLEDTIIPDREVGRALADMAHGAENAALGARLQGDLRFLVVTVNEDTAGTVRELDLDDDCLAVAVTRDGESEIPDGDTRLRPGDDLLLVAHRKSVADLTERFGRKDGEGG